jgi:hypothetical protein
MQCSEFVIIWWNAQSVLSFMLDVDKQWTIQKPYIAINCSKNSYHMIIKQTVTVWNLHTACDIYRVIKKSLYTWWLQYRKLQVMFKVSPTSLQTFIDTPNCVLKDCVQYSTVHIPNVSCDGQQIKIFLCVFCTVIIRCTETFWSSCIT